VVDSEWDIVGIGEYYGMLVEANTGTAESAAEALPAFALFLARRRCPIAQR
jgi:hypothetical protein